MPHNTTAQLPLLTTWLTILTLIHGLQSDYVFNVDIMVLLVLVPEIPSFSISFIFQIGVTAPLLIIRFFN